MVSPLLFLGLFKTPPVVIVVPPPTTGLLEAAMTRTANVSYTSTPIWPAKDPDDILDYSLNWSPIIDDPEDTIKTVAMSIVSGDVSVLKFGFVAEDQKTTVWLQGGTVDSKVQTRVTTTKGRRADQTVNLRIATR